MLNKLNFKHDKIVDIQKALHSADINNDKQVDFDEWRQDLKTWADLLDYIAYKFKTFWEKMIHKVLKNQQFLGPVCLTEYTHTCTYLTFKYNLKFYLITCEEVLRL